ncbi:MAG: hypothetical protein ACR2MX_15990 [Cyclobacteriaceae bacterium]
MRSNFLKLGLLSLVILLMSADATRAQNGDTQNEFDTESALEYLSEVDSLSLISLIDSLLSLEGPTSQLSFNLGYTSLVVNAGRDLNVKQYGFSPGISYFHKSGAFGTISGYWNSEVAPKYNLTVATLGYIGLLSKRLSFVATYDHSFFTPTEPEPYPDWYGPRLIEFLEELSALSEPLNNTLSLSANLDFKYIEPSVEYSFLFGSQTAHRIRADLAGNFDIRKVGFLDKINIRPTASVLVGNQDIIAVRFSRDVLIDRELPLIVNQSDPFGLMNYNFSIPVSFYARPFSLSVDYNLNLPIALPGEDLEIKSNTFFSVLLSYTISL